MYRLDSTRRSKIVFGVLALVFFVLFIRGCWGGGYEIITDDFMTEPLSSIVKHTRVEHRMP